MKDSLCDDLLNSKKILYCALPKLVPYVTGKKDFNPWSVEIHPTAKCNHRCIHCSYKERNENRKSIDQEIMEKLVDSIINMKVKGVYFSGGGEPTVYPNLSKYIEKLYSNGVEASLLTNGTLLESSGIVDIANMLNYIAISVPSCEIDTYEKIVGTRLLDRVLSGPQQIKDKHGDNSPIIGARIVITNLIYKEVENILETMKEKNFDYALFKVVRDYEDRGLGINKDAENYLTNVINKLSSEGKLDRKFTNLEYIFNFKKDIEVSNICHTNNMGLLANVSPEGEVYPNIVEIDDKDFCIGNLYENSLEEIWNSDRHNEVKNISNEKYAGHKCKNCRAMSYNKYINDIIENMPSKEDSFI